jgi:sulfur-carrier protein
VAIVRIPPVLRPSVGGARQVEASGNTLDALLADLFVRFPDMRAKLLSEDGDLSRFVNVFVNDQDVRYLEGMRTSVAGDDVVVLLPAMAGGALTPSA